MYPDKIWKLFLCNMPVVKLKSHLLYLLDAMRTQEKRIFRNIKKVHPVIIDNVKGLVSESGYSDDGIDTLTLEFTSRDGTVTTETVDITEPADIKG